MAKNDNNNRQGKLAELAVAGAFVKHGCAVNFLTFMDVGMDLHVHMPDGLTSPEGSSWEMSGQAGHIQVKSTQNWSFGSISTTTANSWTLGTQTGAPTILVGIKVNGAESVEYYYFDPLTIDLLAYRAQEEEKSKFSVALSRGEIVEPSDLFHKLAFWMRHGSFFLSPALQRPWGVTSEDIWDKTCAMIEQMIISYEFNYRSYGHVVTHASFEFPAERLLRAFFRGISQTESEQNAYLDRTFPSFVGRVSEEISRSGTTDEGWYRQGLPRLSKFTSAESESDALSSLDTICATYGEVIKPFVNPQTFN
jgi:hypothetical protein